MSSQVSGKIVMSDQSLKLIGAPRQTLRPNMGMLRSINQNITSRLEDREQIFIEMCPRD